MSALNERERVMQKVDKKSRANCKEERKLITFNKCLSINSFLKTLPNLIPDKKLLVPLFPLQNFACSLFLNHF